MPGETFDAGTVYAEAHLDREEFQEEVAETVKDLRRLSQRTANPSVGLRREVFDREMEKIKQDLADLKKSRTDPSIGANTEEAREKTGRVREWLRNLRRSRTDPSIGAQAQEFNRTARGIRRQLRQLARWKTVVTITANARSVFRTVRRIRGQIGSLRGMAMLTFGFGMNMEAIRAVKALSDQWLSFRNLLKASVPMLVPLIGSLTGAFGGLAASLGGAAGALGVWAVGAIPAITKAGEFSSELEKARNRLAQAETQAQRQSALQEINFLFSEMTPTMEKTVVAIQDIKNGWAEFQEAIQPGVLKVLKQAIDVISLSLKRMTPIVNAVSPLIVDWLHSMEASLDSGTLQKFFQWLGTTGVSLLDKWGRAFGQAFAGVLNLLMAFTPLAEDTATGARRMATQFNEWAKSLRTDPDFLDFMRDVRAIMPDLMSIIESLVEAFQDLNEVLMPVFKPLLSFLADFMEQHPTLTRMIVSFFALGGALTSLIKIVGGAVLKVTLLSMVLGQATTAIRVMTGASSVLSAVMAKDFAGAIRLLRGGMLTLVARATGVSSAIGIMAGTLDVLGFKSAAASMRMKAFNAGLLKSSKVGRVATKVIRGLGIAFKIAMGPVGWIILAVTALVAGFMYLWNNSAAFRDFWIDLWDQIQKAAVWTWENILKPTFDALVAAWDAVVAGTKAFVNAMVSAWNAVSSAFQTAWNVIEPILSAIWKGLRVLALIVAVVVVGPIIAGFKVLKAAFTTLWSNAVKPSLEQIAAAAKWLWNSVLEPIFNFIWDLFKAVGQGIATVYNYVIKPIIEAYAAIWKWIWNNVISPILNFIADLFTSTGDTMDKVYNTVIKPVIDAFAAAGKWLWQNILKPVWQEMKRTWESVVNRMRWVWVNILKPVWNAISAAARWLWNTILSPVFTFIQNRWNQMVARMKVAWDTVLKPAWDAISAAASWLWETILQPIWNAMQAGWERLMNRLNWVWENILSPVFEAIKSGIGLVQDAFQSTLDGIKSIWNDLISIVAKPVNFVLIDILKEGILSAWNKIAGFLQLDGLKIDLSAIQPVTWGEKAKGGIIPGYAPGQDTVPTMLSPGEAVLTPGATKALGKENILALNDMFAPGMATGGIVGNPLRNSQDSAGNFHGLFGGVFDWVGDAASGIGEFLKGGFDKVVEIGGQVVDIATDPVGYAEKVLNSILDGALGDRVTSSFGKIITEMPKNLIGGLVDKVKSWFESEEGGGGGRPTADARPAGQWRGVVEQALNMLNLPMSLLDDTLKQIQIESGGNPNAVNNWDINAQRGTPSKGLLQTIAPTFQAHKMPGHNNILNPLDNVLAGLRYTQSRYGSIDATWPTRAGYDNGGDLKPGLNTVYNGTGKVEHVQSPKERDALVREVRKMNALLESGAGTTINGTITQDAVPELMKDIWFQAKHASKGVDRRGS